jgi:hypothetical protein
MKYRKLRIAFSVTCGIACVLLVVLWVRSYWIVDEAYLRIPGKTEYYIASIPGVINSFVNDFRGKGMNFASDEWYTKHDPAPDVPITLLQHGDSLGAVFQKFRYRYVNGFGHTFLVPYWCVVLVALTASLLTWPSNWRFRFSLRTLLIATTLVAVMLGLIIYAAR